MILHKIYKYSKISSFGSLYVPRSNFDGTGSIDPIDINRDIENEPIMLERYILWTFIYMGVPWFVDSSWTIKSIEERDQK